MDHGERIGLVGQTEINLEGYGGDRSIYLSTLFYF